MFTVRQFEKDAQVMNTLAKVQLNQRLNNTIKLIDRGSRITSTKFCKININYFVKRVLAFLVQNKKIL